ncbi:MAG: efflux RND transporter periplasmic adaptor subunit [Pirellulaceae bacterium]|nr:efflux RND transporter periplasmic adaptor subunit [Pirellulaceae bacterium]
MTAILLLKPANQAASRAERSVSARFRGVSRHVMMALCAVFVLLETLHNQGRVFAQEPVPIRATVVHREVVQEVQTFIGNVTPIRKALIGSGVEGRVAELMFEAGDAVIPTSSPTDPLTADSWQLGVPLARLQTDTVDIELAAARSELKSRQAMHAELQAALPTEIRQAEATQRAAQSRFELAKRQRERAESLMERGRVVSESELELARSAHQASHFELLAAEADLDRIQETQHARMARLEASILNQLEAIRLLEDRRRKHTVFAPFEGIVSARHAELGQWLMVGAPVAEVVQMNPIEVVITVPQNSLRDLQRSISRTSAAQGLSASSASTTLRPGLAAQVVVHEEDPAVQGEVIAVLPAADLLSRSFPVKIRARNPRTELGFQLLPGMLVKVQLAIGQRQQRLLADKDALVLNKDGQFVVRVDRSVQPHRAQLVPVKLGATVDHRVELIGDVSEEDWLVVDGNERLRNEQTVKVVNSDDLQTTPTLSESNPVSQPVATAEKPNSGAVTN